MDSANTLILHRDLKPANIFIDIYYEPHIGDFGLASNRGKDALSSGQGLVGSPLYMAPELNDDAYQKERLDHNLSLYTEQVDVYAFGLTVYEMVIGQRPVRKLGRVEVTFEPRENFPRMQENVSEKLKTLIFNCTNVEYQKRPSAQEILATVQELYPPI